MDIDEQLILDGDDEGYEQDPSWSFPAATSDVNRINVDAAGYLVRNPPPVGGGLSKSQKRKQRKLGAEYARVDNPPVPFAQLKKRYHQQMLGNMESLAGKCADIIEWLDYGCGSFSETPNDFIHHGRRGNALLRHQISVLLQNPSSFCIQVQDPDFLVNLQERLFSKERWLQDCLVVGYADKEMFELKKKDGNKGYSVGALTLSVLCYLRFLRHLLGPVIALWRSNHRIIPSASYPQGSLVNFRNQGAWAKLIPEPLLMRSLDFPFLCEQGCMLYGIVDDAAIGSYTQRQVWMQMSKLAIEWHNLPIGHPEVVTFLECLQLRVAELFCLPWKRALQLYDSHPDKPLDMIDKYVCPTRCNGVLPDDRGVQLDLDSLMKGKKQQTNEERNQWKWNEFMSPSRAFMVECTGILVPMYCALDVNEYLLIPNILDAELLEAYKQELAWVFVENTSWVEKIPHSTDVYGILLEGLKNWMKFKRGEIMDPGYKEELVKDQKRQCLPFGLRERFAFAKNSYLRMTKSVEELEDYEIPRPELDQTRAYCKTLTVGNFEETLFPSRFMHYATLKLFQKIVFEFEKKLFWLDAVCTDSRSFEPAWQVTNMPLILMIGGDIYSRVQTNYMVRVPDAHNAILLWILQIIVEHDSRMKFVDRYAQQFSCWRDIVDAILKATPFGYAAQSDHSSDESDSSNSEDSAGEQDQPSALIDDAEEQTNLDSSSDTLCSSSSTSTLTASNQSTAQSDVAFRSFDEPEPAVQTRLVISQHSQNVYSSGGW